MKVTLSNMPSVHECLHNKGDHSPGNQGKVGGGGQIFDEKVKEKSVKFMKNCKSQGKMSSFCKCLRKC